MEVMVNKNKYCRMEFSVFTALYYARLERNREGVHRKHLYLGGDIIIFIEL